MNKEVKTELERKKYFKNRDKGNSSDGKNKVKKKRKRNILSFQWKFNGNIYMYKKLISKTCQENNFRIRIYLPIWHTDT